MDALMLLIADSDENFRRALSLALQDSFYIRTCSTGTQALQMLRSQKAHILVVDLMLPEMDGLTLLQTLSREKICPEVLATAPDLSPEVFAAVNRLNVSRILRKPCQLTSAVEHIRLLRRELTSQRECQKCVRQMLLQLHIPAHLDGFLYLHHCLPELIQDPGLAITKHLYRDTARAFGTGVKPVEHSIRHAIELTWKLHRSDWQPYFPNHTKRPSNGEFMHVIANILRKNLE